MVPQSEPAWPRKTRELMNHHMDSAIWNDFGFRDDDIIVATYAKSGTTWTQQIVGQLVFHGDESVAMHDVSPWLDLRADGGGEARGAGIADPSSSDQDAPAARRIGVLA
jgi:hypothetical protein